MPNSLLHRCYLALLLLCCTTAAAQAQTIDSLGDHEFDSLNVSYIPSGVLADKAPFGQLR